LKPLQFPFWTLGKNPCNPYRGISLQNLSDAIVNTGFKSDTQAELIDTRSGGSIIADNNPALLLTVPSGDTQAVNKLLAGGNGSSL